MLRLHPISKETLALKRLRNAERTTKSFSSEWNESPAPRRHPYGGSRLNQASVNTCLDPSIPSHSDKQGLRTSFTYHPLLSVQQWFWNSRGWGCWQCISWELVQSSVFNLIISGQSSNIQFKCTVQRRVNINWHPALHFFSRRGTPIPLTLCPDWPCWPNPAASPLLECDHRPNGRRYTIGAPLNFKFFIHFLKV